MASDSSPIRIGILGCAGIARKNATAILQEPSGCCVTAVASRSRDKVNDFVQAFLANQPGGISVAVLDSYDELIQQPDVDALYIPLPTTLHKEWVKKALKAGKHVMLEKPVALSAEEFLEMLAVAKANKCYLMDGTMFVHHPRTKNFRHAIHNTTVMGSLKRVEAGFSFCGSDTFFKNDIRVKKDGDPLGCLGDMAWYVVRAGLLAFGPDCPVTSAQVVDFEVNKEGVPVDATCFVKFTDNKVLSFHCGFLSQFRQYIKVIGTEAWAEIDDFVLPKKHPVSYTMNSMNLTEYDLVAKHTSSVEEFDGPVQEVLMWQTFSQVVKAFENTSDGWDGTTIECREANRLAQISFDTQKIIDLLMGSITKGGARIEI
jgi:predicted dehydrogenase